MFQLGIKKLSEHATLPIKAHLSDSGFDLYAAEDVIIQPGETIVVKTDIALVLPEGFEAQVRPRSGITSNTKLRVQLGTIDNSYRGGIGIIVDNISTDYVTNETYWTRFVEFIDGNRAVTSAPEGRIPKTTYKIRKGDKLAQLVIQHLPKVQTYDVDDLGVSERGSNGFGSTGV